MNSIVLRRSIVVLAVGCFALALLSPAWRPAGLEIPGAYSGVPPTPLFTGGSLLLLLPVSIALTSLWAFFSGRLRGGQLCWIAVAMAYLNIQLFALLQADGSSAMPRRYYQSNYVLDALLFDDLGQLFATYHELFEELTGHGKTHPPGACALYWLTMRCGEALAAGSEDPGYTGFVIEGRLGAFLWPFVQVLWLLPAWSLGRRRYGERSAAVGVIFGAMAPSAVLISPSVEAFLPLVSVLGFAAFDRALESGKYRFSLCTGFVSAAGTLISWGFGGLAGVYLSYVALKRSPLRSRAVHLLMVLCGGGILLAGFYLLFGYRPWDQLEANVGTHYVHGVNDRRPYAPYLWISPFVFFVWAGLPLATGFFLSLRERTRNPLALATLLGLAAITFSGVTRGETERLWLPFLPLVCLVGGHGLQRDTQGTRGDSVGWTLLALLTMSSAVLLGNWWAWYK